MIDYKGKVPVAELLERTTPASFDTDIVRYGTLTPHADWVNRLYRGDNLQVMAALRQDPKVKGKVNLCYIDPPYATGKKFFMRDNDNVLGYDDTLVGEPFYEFFRQRLIFIKELLAPDGCIYVHLDHNMICEAKIIMDEIFGPSHFRSLITREKCQAKNQTLLQYCDVADYLLLYSVGDKMLWEKQFSAHPTKSVEKLFPYVDEKTGERFNTRPVHAPETRHGETGRAWRGKLPPAGKHWLKSPEDMDKLDEANELYWSPSGNPRLKIWARNHKGIGITNMWTDVKDSGSESRFTKYPTEKNLLLLKRVVLSSSRPGDLVLDAFSGSGTTLHAASEAGRRWIGIDQMDLAIENTVKRGALHQDAQMEVWRQK